MSDTDRQRAEALADFFDQHLTWLTSHGHELTAPDILMSLLVLIGDVLRMAGDFPGLQGELVALIADMLPKVISEVTHVVPEEKPPTIH